MVNDTITALATPPGVSGLAVIRISGDEAIEIVNSCFSGKGLNEALTHTIHYGKINDGEDIIDSVTVSIFKKPNSYTGEDVIEIGCHGGNIVYGKIIDIIINKGARLAEPGEFTRRAFLNKKMDLAQVEAVADIIHSLSDNGVETAARQLEGGFSSRLETFRINLLDIASKLELELDFADEDIEFADKDTMKKMINDTINFCNELTSSFKSSEIMRSGYFVGIAGYPNSGKSTLFNSLLKRKRAITSRTPGTTRDYLEETIMIDGMAIKIIDTAGIRETEDTIEIQGIQFVESILKQSNMIFIINDITKGEGYSELLIKNIYEKYPEKEIVILHNKIDKIRINEFKSENKSLFISAKMDIGIDELKKYISKKANESTERVKDILVNQRHAVLLNRTKEILSDALSAIRNGMETEIISIDIRTAAKTLGEITGNTWNDDVLNNIFSNFCIGK